ncbi:MAG TPA: hypothetical protein VFI90_13710, partial [Rubrobacter sp.]|nr:hypothetical protein [Rubrobacter sp.]
MAQRTNVSAEPGELLLRRSLDRARFLRLLGAGLSMFPATFAALGGPAGAQDAVSGIPAMSPDGEYPIGIWWPPPPDPPPDKTLTEYYAEISAAGFNFVIGGNDVVNDTENPPALQAAADNGLRFLLTDARLRNLIRDGGGTIQASSLEKSSPSIMQSLLEQEGQGPEFRAAAVSRDEVKQRVRELVATYSTYPAFAGINIYDEPKTSMFGLVNAAEDELRTSPPEELPYINVWPSYTSATGLGARDYTTYLERYFAAVNPPLLCFDHYPLLKKGITPDYFYNWAVIRNFAARFGVPSWAFIQSVGFNGSEVGLPNRRKPDRQEILWQVNVSLAYGAKGIQYFTYWTPEAQPGPSIRFGQALISDTGQQTELYDYAREVNGYLKVVGRVLLPLYSESVVHARERRLPMGARRFRGDRYVREVSGSPVILSRFSEEGTTNRYLFVVNRSFANVARTRLKMGGAVSKVSRLNITTGEFDPVRLVGRPR